MDVEQTITDFLYLYREFSPLNYGYGYLATYELGLIHELLS
jgi:hypothetical protein